MKAQPVIVYLPDTRGVEVSRFGLGNSKLGFGVFTYSRLAGDPARRVHETHDALGLAGSYRVVDNSRSANPGGTCPGSTDECEDICYAKRISGPVRDNYQRNAGDDVPEIPATCRVLRIHVSGDFDSERYVRNWVMRLLDRPEVTAWAYTRSWRVLALLPALETLRGLPNVQLFASMDRSTVELPPAGWRRAWIDGDTRAGTPVGQHAHHIASALPRNQNFATFDNAMTYVCPEETGRKRDCLDCGYCFEDSPARPARARAIVPDAKSV